MGSSGGGTNTVSYQSDPAKQAILQAIMPMFTGIMGGQLPTQPPQPSQGWMNNIAPSIQQGVWEPYKVGGQNMLNEIIGGGMAGSNRGGLSNSATQLLGDYYAKAGTQYGQQLWNMTYPQSYEAWRMPYSLASSALGVSLPDAVVGGGGNNYAGTALGAGMLGLGAYNSGMFGGLGGGLGIGMSGLTAPSLIPGAASTAGILGGLGTYGTELAPLFLL